MPDSPRTLLRHVDDLIADLRLLRERVAVLHAPPDPDPGGFAIAPFRLSPSERIVYALLMRRDVVAVETLISQIWRERQPERPEHQCRMYVSAIRKRMNILEDGLGRELETQSGGIYGHLRYRITAHGKQRLREFGSEVFRGGK